MSGVAIVAGADPDLAQTLRRALTDCGMAVGGLGDISHTTDDGDWAAWARADFCDLDACRRAVEALQQRLGDPAVLVYARSLRDEAPLHKMSRNQWTDVVEGMLYGAFNVCQTIAPGMRARREGRIVLVSSLAARSGAAGHTNHCAAAAGLLGLGKALARENAALGVTVNMVSPGPLASADDDSDRYGERPPIGRYASATDVAGCVAFLASPAAAFITGACLDLNGGGYMAV